MLVLCYSNEKNNIGLVNYERSLKKHHIKYKVVGIGDPWINFSQIGKTCYEELCSEAYSEDDIVCVTDAFDVLVTCSEEEIMEKYSSSSDLKIWVGTEPTHGPGFYLERWWKLHEKTPLTTTQCRYLNSGCYMGPVRLLKHLLSFLMNFSDDQFGMCVYAETYPNNVELDTNQQLCGNITGWEIAEYSVGSGERVTHTNGSTPCFIHIPGTLGDFNMRMDYFGKHVLKEDYIPLTIVEVMEKWWKKARAKKIYTISLIFLGLVALKFPRAVAVMGVIIFSIYVFILRS